MASCTKLTDAARLVQVLQVDGYSASTAMCYATSGSDDGHIKSRWSVGGYDWEVRLYPATLLFGKVNGVTSLRWLGLKLVLLGAPGGTCNVKAALGCRLVDPRGILEPAEEKSVSKVFKYSACCLPSPPLKIMERGDLESSGYLRDDCLALQCTVTVLIELPEAAIIPAAKEVIAPSSNLHEHLGELLRSETGADVAFLVAGESFAAHKNILAARSPVFTAEFFGEMEEKRSRRVEVKDMEAAAFRAMLHFIYTDTLPEQLEQQEEEAATTMAQHLLAAADRYGLDRLKLICEGKLSRGISIDTAATTLALAEQHNCEQLKAKSVEFIVSTPAILDAVAVTEGYKHLVESCPSVLTDLLKSARWGNN